MTEATFTVVTSREPEATSAPCVAVIVTYLSAAVAKVVTVKFALEAPAATVTVAGTVAVAGSELLRLKVRPPVGALPERVNVPTDLRPPVTERGAKERLLLPDGNTVSVALTEAPLRVAETLSDVT